MGQILDKLRRYERIGVRSEPETLPPMLAVPPSASAACGPSPAHGEPEIEPAPGAPAVEIELTLTVASEDEQPIAPAVRPKTRSRLPIGPRLPVDDLPRVAFAHRLADAVDVHDELVAALAAPFLEVYGWELVAARLASTVEWLAERHPIFEKIRVAPDGLLDPDALVHAALAHPREGGHHLRCALRDLVAHLEFDLLNDPRIEDRAGALEGRVGKLRERAALHLERCAESDPASR
jgi:hypothetical protein